MPVFMQRGQTWLASKLNAPVAGRSVIYTRGTRESEPFTATIISEEYKELVEGDLKITAVVTEWMIIPADVVIDGTPLNEPRDGDELEEVDNGERYEVLPQDVRSVEKFGTFGVGWRVYTKRVRS